MHSALMRRFVRDESGVALLEFAILSTVLLLLVFGAIDFGRAMFTANNLAAAARDGARFGATMTTPTPATIRTRVLAYPFTSLGGGALQSGQIVVECPPNGTACTPVSTIQSIRVTINYAPFPWFLANALMGNTLKDTLRAQSTFRWEGSGS